MIPCCHEETLGSIKNGCHLWSHWSFQKTLPTSTSPATSWGNSGAVSKSRCFQCWCGPLSSCDHRDILIPEGDGAGDDVLRALRLDDLQEVCLSLEDLCSEEALCPFPGRPLTLATSLRVCPS